MDQRADVLIVTVTKVEGRAVLEAFGAATQTELAVVSIGDRTYHDLGIINKAHVFMALSEMGSSGPGGSQEAVRKAIDALKPDAVIMVGIAFGIDEKKQAIGDILVSKQILHYDLQRISKDKALCRGDKVHASPWLIDRMANADFTWDETVARVTQGLILSGDKLVDNIDYRDDLVQLAQDAIGGEMEGVGLYVACHDKKIDWILIKAICDWADGNKGEQKAERQFLAARNAARYVLHALQLAPLKRDQVLGSGNLFKEDIQVEKLLAQTEITRDMVSDIAKAFERTHPIPSPQNYPKALVNSSIQTQLTTLRRARFFPGFAIFEFAVAFGNRLRSGEFEGGSDDVRNVALAWCARILVATKHNGEPAEFLKFAKLLGHGVEVEIAEAFMESAEGKVDDALGKLSKFSSPVARSAALMILNIHRGGTASIDWLFNSGLTQLDLDPDGKVALFAKLIECGRWDIALEQVKLVNEEDYQQAPALLHYSALIHLAQAIPEGLRSEIVNGVPYELDSFPVASNESSLCFRRKAEELFSRHARAALELECLQAAENSNDYVIWLKLIDSGRRAEGLEILRTSMRVPELRRLHFALKFGLKLDIAAVEREIERQTALTGGTSTDAALARFSIALLQESPEGVANYIERHRLQLYRHINKQFLQKLEIEVFMRCGAKTRAEELLVELIGDGLPEDEQRQLLRIIAEPHRTSESAAHIADFEGSGNLSDLHRLVSFLSDHVGSPGTELEFAL